MKKDSKSKPGCRELVDQYRNVFMVTDELSRGGQGVVFRTRDADIAIKQPIDRDTQKVSADPVVFAKQIGNIRLLPIPESINVTMPLSTLADEPGYTMRLLSGMMPVESFDLAGNDKQALLCALKLFSGREFDSSFKPTENERKALLFAKNLVLDKHPRPLDLPTAEESLVIQQALNPSWLANVPSADQKLDLVFYGRTGGLLRRLAVLHKTAAILARLHSAGIVYGDISPNNVFFGEGPEPDVWIIDPDNMRLENSRIGSAVYTPRFGAPEIVAGSGQAGPRTDCWAFAVLAFRMLALTHPFRGKKVLEPGDWADEPQQDSPGAGSPDDRAYAGEFPFIDDEDDDSNAFTGGLPRTLVLTDGLRRLFQETFGVGRLSPWRRPPMLLWARELAWAFDHAVDCPGCGMGFYADRHAVCPYCDTLRVSCAVIRSSRWEKVARTDSGNDVFLPGRLFQGYAPADAWDESARFAAYDETSRSFVAAFGQGEDFPAPIETFEMGGLS